MIYTLKPFPLTRMNIHCHANHCLSECSHIVRSDNSTRKEPCKILADDILNFFSGNIRHGISCASSVSGQFTLSVKIIFSE